MLTRRKMLKDCLAGVAGLLAAAFLRPSLGRGAAGAAVTHSDSEWRKLLTADQYAVLREDGTERPFTSPLLHEERVGTFACAGCELPLFSSKTKFDSGTGWPSFWAPLDDAVQTATDDSLGMERTAVSCQ